MWSEAALAAALQADGGIETWNDAAARLYGYTANEVIGRHRSVLFTAEDVARGAHQHELDTARTNGKASEETWQVRKDGSLFWSNGTMSALYDDAGSVRGFKIYLPRTELRADRSSVAPASQQVRRTTETILLVEDEPQLRVVACAILRRAGYHVIEASNGVEAFDAAKEFAGAIHVLLTDVVMPRMSGRKL